MKIQPVIKWSGSKRYQVEDLIKYFPKEIDIYYEPFLGSGVVMYRLMCSVKHSVNKFVGSDKNRDLINIWRIIKNNPDRLIKEYDKMHKRFLDKGASYYYKVRDRYNKNHNSEDFFFITRTCFNGLIRYNSDGILNSSLHPNRKGVKPNKLREVVWEWSYRLNKYDVEFYCGDYREISPEIDDFVYADPPYKLVDKNNMYFRGFNHKEFFEWIRNLKCKYAFSFDGKSGEDDNTGNVPVDVYREHYYINSGLSSYKRLAKNEKANVKDSLYLSFKEEE